MKRKILFFGLFLFGIIYFGVVELVSACTLASQCYGSQVCSEATGQTLSCSCEGGGTAEGTCNCSCGGGGGSGWTCFGAGTKVKMASGNNFNIEDIKVGDKVVSQDEQGNKSVSTVVKLDQPIREHMCRVDFGNGDILKMTNEHPLLTTEGWKSITPSKTAEENPDLIVASLSIGDKVIREDGGTGEIKDIACWSAKTPAYNLILDGDAHTYFAGGYLAHNKGNGRDSITCPGSQVGSCAAPAVRRNEEYLRVANPGGFMCEDEPFVDKWVSEGRPQGFAGYDRFDQPMYKDRCDTNCKCCLPTNTYTF